MRFLLSLALLFMMSVATQAQYVYGYVIQDDRPECVNFEPQDYRIYIFWPAYGNEPSVIAAVATPDETGYYEAEVGVRQWHVAAQPGNSQISWKPDGYWYTVSYGSQQLPDFYVCDQR